MGRVPDPRSHDAPVPLAPTLAALPEAPRVLFDRLREGGFAAVQLSSARPGLRPRDLDGSARRDLRATLARREMRIAGIDAWVPPAHLADAATAERAVDALIGAIGLAADLGRVPVSTRLPPPGVADLEVAAILADALRRGVGIADHARPPVARPGAGPGIDPAACLAEDEAPEQAVAAAGEALLAARLVDLSSAGMRIAVGDPSEGRLDLVAYRVALHVVGFAAPLVVDARQWADPWEGLRRSREAWLETAPA